ncbi:MAG TPA: VOC family protein [Ilumatobacteraceae bacterium]|nr:VOC family protein [Ilumatobacteraceae bacterium]
MTNVTTVSLRWYSIVIDCRDISAQSRWWADAIGWRVVLESADEVVLAPAHETDEVLAKTPWDEMGPALVFVPVPEGKTVKNRIHIDVAPHTSDDREAEIERLLAMGARRVDVGQSGRETWEVLADPEGNEFCVLSSRET